MKVIGIFAIFGIVFAIAMTKFFLGMIGGL